MLKNILRKCIIIIICQSLIYSPLIRATGPIPLPSGDQAEPEISQKKYHKTVKKGADVQITVTVTDNDAVRQVTLYYRTISSTNNYNRKTMDKIGDTDDYRATIKSDTIKAPGVEYYVEAIDNAGNTSSAPLIRVSQLTLPPRDQIKPIISQEKYINTVKKGADHQITVSVTDNVGVKKVTLYYRTKYTEKYISRSMLNIVGTDDYRATISAEQIKSPGIEYYIQAADTAGNTFLHGYPFSPLSAELVDEEAPVVATSDVTNTLENKEEPTKKWLWIGLGVLAVGVVAAAAGGGGDDGGGTTTTTTTGDITVTW